MVIHLTQRKNENRATSTTSLRLFSAAALILLFFRQGRVFHSSNSINTATTVNDTPTIPQTANADEVSKVPVSTTTDRLAFNRSITIDVVSIGSKSRMNLQETQRSTWASHNFVRHFFAITEDHDEDPYCASGLNKQQALEIVGWCRRRYQNSQFGSWLTHRWSHYYTSTTWLRNKKNPSGWMCAQTRFAYGLVRVLRTVQAELPDYLLLVDDDTHFNIGEFHELLQMDPTQPYIGAGCRVNNGKEVRFAFGGYGWILSKRILQRLLIPLHCYVSNSSAIASQYTSRRDYNYIQRACQSIYDNLILEQPHYKQGMALLDLLHKRARVQLFREFQNWTTGFCFHGDHYLGIVLDIYGTALLDGESDILPETYPPHYRPYLQAIRNSEIDTTNKAKSEGIGDCLNEFDRCPPGSIACHYQNATSLQTLFEQQLRRQHPNHYLLAATEMTPAKTTAIGQ